jgi:hypothetical protein
MNDSEKELLIDSTKKDIEILENKLKFRRNYVDRLLFEITGKDAKCTNYECSSWSEHGDLNCQHHNHNKKRYISRCEFYTDELF